MTAIRDVEPRDLERLHALNERSVPEVTSTTLDEFEHLVAMSAVALAVVVPDPPDPAEAVVGFCLVLFPGQAYTSVNYQWFMDRFTDAAYLDRVVIDERVRGQGLGTAMYAEVERRLVASPGPIARLGLEVNLEPPNPLSLAFHERLGFIEAGRQRTPYGAEVVLLQKLLHPA
jgi:predicted GNAT superfamily acetyltransferase